MSAPRFQSRPSGTFFNEELRKNDKGEVLDLIGIIPSARITSLPKSGRKPGKGRQRRRNVGFGRGTDFGPTVNRYAYDRQKRKHVLKPVAIGELLSLPLRLLDGRLIYREETAGVVYSRPLGLLGRPVR